jgi:universal stress protein A
MRFSRIICPVDFSAPAHEALLAAVQLAIRFEATLTLVNVYSLPLLAVPEMSVDPTLLTEILAHTDAQLASWTREAIQLGARRVEAAKLEGVAWDVIVKVARDGGADLIVIGTHGHTGLRHALVGSVAERVVRHASCPVLVVRSPAP